ncbi:MAG: hypothetical protein ACREOE_17690, partial [Gemmatimonadales bacterium]
MLLALALLWQDPLAVRADTIKPRHDAIHYDIAAAISDTGKRFAAEVTTRWRLTSSGPVVVELDTALSVVAVWVGDSAGRQ